MPRNKESRGEFYKRIASDYPGVFRCDNSVLFCLMCDTDVAAKQASQVKQHLSTTKHSEAVERKTRSKAGGSQTLLTTLHETTDRNRNTNEFSMDLAKCFLEANIPLHKITNPSVKRFIEKHTKYAAPSESALRQKYLPILYEETIEKLKQRAAGKYIWVSLDESTDCEQRFVANFVFGILGEEQERGRSYLFASAVLDATNSSTIAKFFDESLNDLSKS